MADLRLRAIVGAILIAVALIADWFGGWLFAIAVATGAGLIFVEWRAMTRGWGAGWFVGGVAYALVPAIALLWTRLLPDGASLVLWAFVVTWATDIFAYLVGRAFGGPKLAPAMSPNKTWSGLAGGVAGATLLGGLLASYLGLPTEFLLAAPIFAVAAQIGDLLESGLKRRAGVKDAGKMLPGHGGVMDRLDGLVPVAVMTAVLATVAT
jgi:phosphatidate cytidylyltransferase